MFEAYGNKAPATRRKEGRLLAANSFQHGRVSFTKGQSFGYIGL